MKDFEENAVDLNKTGSLLAQWSAHLPVVKEIIIYGARHYRPTQFRNKQEEHAPLISFALMTLKMVCHKTNVI